eukprot:CAMPEP_0184487292 /NCGR_PEP_ID=MMETSP0113_2-20130426/9703_1 /TAXON_ID=91329 /ORGANISM="Norrisiella sphaerica, Strain BC52" /LENGTH=206 /DNA_ID=CAMNT_0026869539 /DNA_START=164 /DNA_END=784 /DNA_ORIENTATION=+
MTMPSTSLTPSPPRSRVRPKPESADSSVKKVDVKKQRHAYHARMSRMRKKAEVEDMKRELQELRKFRHWIQMLMSREGAFLSREEYEIASAGFGHHQVPTGYQDPRMPQLDPNPAYFKEKKMKQEETENMKREIAELRQYQNQAQAVLARKDNVISDLNALVRRLTGETQDLREKLKDKDQDLKRLEASLILGSIPVKKGEERSDG